MEAKKAVENANLWRDRLYNRKSELEAKSQIKLARKQIDELAKVTEADKKLVLGKIFEAQTRLEYGHYETAKIMAQEAQKVIQRLENGMS